MSPGEGARATGAEIRALTSALLENAAACRSLLELKDAIETLAESIMNGGRALPTGRVSHGEAASVASAEEERAIGERLRQIQASGTTIKNAAEMRRRLLEEFRTLPELLELRLREAEEHELAEQRTIRTLKINKTPRPSEEALVKAREKMLAEGWKPEAIEKSPSALLCLAREIEGQR